MFGIARLECECYFDLVDPELQSDAMMLNVENIHPEARNLSGEPGERAGPVVDDDVQHQIPAGRRKTMLDQSHEQQRIHVAAAHDREHRIRSGDLPREDRSEADGTRRLDDSLRAL